MLTLSAALLLACAPKVVSSAANPILPAVEAPLYAAAPGYTPSDEVVAGWLGERAIDETLSGAAGAVALIRAGGGRVDGAAVSWGAYRAGWPHPIDSWSVLTLPRGEVPPTSFLSDLADEGSSLGVARARGAAGDTWVAVSSWPRITLGAFPRTLHFGAAFAFPIEDAGAWTDLSLLAVGPDLRIRRDNVALDVNGEWIAELWGTDEADGVYLLARVPLYVGEEAPEDGPFLSVVPAEVENLSGAILDALNELRGLEGAPRLRVNASLNSAAREGLKRRLETGEVDPEALDRLARLGYPEAAELTCSGETVTDCLEDFWWSIDDRVRLLQPEYLQVGIGAGIGAELSVVVTLAAE